MTLTESPDAIDQRTLAQDVRLQDLLDGLLEAHEPVFWSAEEIANADVEKALPYVHSIFYIAGEMFGLETDGPTLVGDLVRVIFSTQSAAREALQALLRICDHELIALRSDDEGVFHIEHNLDRMVIDDGLITPRSIADAICARPSPLRGER